MPQSVAVGANQQRAVRLSRFAAALPPGCVDAIRFAPRASALSIFCRATVILAEVDNA